MDSRSCSIIPTNLEDSSVVDQPSRLASSRSKSAITSLILEGSAVLGLQNLASGSKGPLLESWVKAFANT
jgi:hypothetical protein